MQILQPVPTNIITGFLGAGKTTAINYLLQHKPARERWAVLVNEFGQIGVDQSLMSGDEGVAIREIPGGCLCCTQGPMLRVALTRLLREVRPDRLLIEPTGLGHPLGITDLLLGADFGPVIDLRTTLCLLDPRVLNQPEALRQSVFLDQLTLADVVVLSKCDLVEEAQRLEAEQLSLNMFPPKQQVISSHNGQIDPALLDCVRHPRTIPARRATTAGTASPRPASPAVPVADVEATPQPGQPLRLSGCADGIHTLGWRFHPQDRFDPERIRPWLDQLAGCLRIKGALRIGHAWLGYNRTLTEVSLSPLAWRRDSRLEILSEQALDGAQLQQQLLACLKPDHSAAD